jgi:hypothetical protein
MTIEIPPTPTTQWNTEQILGEQAVIRRYFEQVRELRRRVLDYEEQFGIPSSEIHEAIDDGRLKETIEVTHWIFDYEMLISATDFD